jgi:D-alanyl-D-alanine carboxypeptidase
VLAIRGILQRQLDETRARLGIPGAQVTIIFRDGSSWTGSSGMADVAGGVEVGPGTAFALASVSKTYTAALVLALAADGRIDLDASARAYIPEAVIDRRITVRQLLDHTSGLDDYFLHPPIDRALQAEPAAFWSVRRTLKYVGRPYFAPGTGWHYSNTNYLYLGLVAERVTGRTLAAALRERFFTPLGLLETWYQAVEEPLGPVAHGYRFASSRVTAPPIDLSDGSDVVPFTSVVTAAAGAGSIAATSADVATWARRLYGGEVLGAAMTDAMLDGVTATAGYRPRVPYGLGVQAFRIDDRPTVGHSGRFLGFRTAVRHFPTESLTIAVLTNQSRADPGLIIEDLLEIVFRPDRPCLSCQRPS